MKQQITTRFLITSFAAALVAAVVIYLVRDRSFFHHLETFSWISLLFFLVITLISFRVNSFAILRSTGQRFMQVFLATIVGKFLLSIILIIVYVLLANPSTYLFIMPFFICFLLYKIIEIIFILRLSKESSYSSTSQ